MSFLQSSASSRYGLTPNVKPKRRQRTSKDQALVEHVHGILYPFHTDSFIPCFLQSNQPSRKLRVFARGTFVTCTADNYGFVVSGPTLASNPSVSNNVCSTAAQAAAQSMTNGTAFTTNSPIAVSSFAAGNARGRCISCGIRVRNITPLQNRGGLLLGLTSQSGNTLISSDIPTTAARLESVGKLQRGDVSGGWNYLYWTSIEDDQMLFVPTDHPVGSNGNVNIQGNLAWAATAPAGVAQTYEWEYVCHGDYVEASSGSTIGTTATYNEPHRDVHECHAIVNRLHEKREICQSPNPTLANVIVDSIGAGKKIVETLSDCLSVVADNAGAIAGAAASVLALSEIF